MSILYFLIPLAMLFVVIAGAVFYWAVRNNQFEDLERQGLSILMDEEKLDALHKSKKNGD